MVTRGADLGAACERARYVWTAVPALMADAFIVARDAL